MSKIKIYNLSGGNYSATSVNDDIKSRDALRHQRMQYLN